MSYNSERNFVQVVRKAEGKCSGEKVFHIYEGRGYKLELTTNFAGLIARPNCQNNLWFFTREVVSEQIQKTAFDDDMIINAARILKEYPELLELLPTPCNRKQDLNITDIFSLNTNPIIDLSWYGGAVNGYFVATNTKTNESLKCYISFRENFLGDREDQIAVKNYLRENCGRFLANLL